MCTHGHYIYIGLLFFLLLFGWWRPATCANICSCHPVALRGCQLRRLGTQRLFGIRQKRCAILKIHKRRQSCWRLDGLWHVIILLPAMTRRARAHLLLHTVAPRSYMDMDKYCNLF
jgi:hypothetical protein